MILTIKNQVAGTRSYLGGIITVADSSQTVVSRDFNVLLAGDAQFLSDLGSNGIINIILNNGVKDLNPGEALDLAKILATFSTDPLATTPLYYRAPIKVNQTGATAAGSTVWSMRNAAISPKQIIIERIYLITAFEAATPLGAASLAYDINRFSTATPTGGSAIAVIKANNIASASGVTDVRYLDTGLSVASVVFEGPFVTIPVPQARGSSVPYNNDKLAIKLAPGEGLAIRLSNASVNGQSIYGEMIWSER